MDMNDIHGTTADDALAHNLSRRPGKDSKSHGIIDVRFPSLPVHTWPVE
jgi:hypothetical protein